MQNMHLTGSKELVEPLLNGLQELQQELSFSLKEDGFPVLVKAGKGMTVSISKNEAVIRYETKADFFRGFSIFMQNIKSEHFELHQEACFQKTGIMFDCSRNGVLTTNTLRFFLRKMALMGINMGMMYTEDTYTVDSRPYFGYLRGRYTFDELKSLDDYADIFGIELIPCIQTLSHLERALHWPCGEILKDTSATLKVNSEETYKFIEDMITAASAPYRSNRIHIGMDEAGDLGRGNYMNENGYCPCSSLMADHLLKVNEILKKHNLHAMMWSDMHFSAASKSNLLYDPDCVFTEEILNGAPENIDLVFWDYYHENEAHYEHMLKKHKGFKARTLFAGGIWTWIGPAADYRKTLLAAVPSLTQCKKQGIPEVFATAWNDDGAETNLLCLLYGLQFYAEFSYTGSYNEENVKSRFTACTGAQAKAFLDLSLFNKLPGTKVAEQGTLNSSKLFLFEDPLLPLFEEDFKGCHGAEYFAEVSHIFKQHRSQNPNYFTLFDFYVSLANALEQKCIWRENAPECVRSKDRAAAAELVLTAHKAADALRELKEKWQRLWFSTNKPFGFEVIDVRMGGIITRMETAASRMNDFANGTIEDIPELSEKKLPYLKTENGECNWMTPWVNIASPNRFVG